MAVRVYDGTGIESPSCDLIGLVGLYKAGAFMLRD